MAPNEKFNSAGFDLQYEILLREEEEIAFERNVVLNSANENQPDQRGLQSLKARASLHRARLEGLILSAQHAAKDDSEQCNNLEALLMAKSRQLIEDECRVDAPLVADADVGGRRFASQFASVGRKEQAFSPDVSSFIDDDILFDEYPECARRNSELDEDDESDDESCDRSTAKRKLTNATFSPEVQFVQQKPPPPMPATKRSGFPIPRPGSRPIDRQHNEHLKPNNGTAQRSQLQPCSHVGNPYQQRGYVQQNQRKGSQRNPDRQGTSSFDYSDNSSFDPQQQSVDKAANQFLAASELGPSFDGKPRSNTNGSGEASKRWNNYENKATINENHLQHRQNPSRSQQLVTNAIRGPKNNRDLSAGLKKKFQPPMKRPDGGNSSSRSSSGPNSNCQGGTSSGNGPGKTSEEDEELPEQLKGCDKELVEKINNDIVDSGHEIKFDDIAGLENAKETVFEMVIYPMQRPELFTGLRSCPRGLLLFGPPGTGKTLIGKAIAHESGATFFSISSSSLTSKWIGEGEKLVRTLFAVANYRAPSVVFMDEVDSLLTQRKSDENEASRRIKTEFLVQLDGAGNAREGHVLVIGATNLPGELDDAARRRFVKRIYVPLPNQSARETLIRTLLKADANSLTEKELAKLARDTDGYSGADLKNLCTDAAMGPIRQLGSKAISMDASMIPPISYKHFRHSLKTSSPSVCQSDLTKYIEWNDTYGSKRVQIDYGTEDSSCDGEND